MPRQLVSRNDITGIVQELEGRGYSGEELVSLATEATDYLEEQRQSQAFLEMSPLGQAWWTTKRTYGAAGELLTSLPAMAIASLRGRYGEARTPGEIQRGTVEYPFQPVPKAATPEMPAGFRFAAEMTGTLARDLPLMGGIAKTIAGGAGRLPMVGKLMGKYKRLAQVGTTAGTFETLGQLGGAPTGQGAVAGLALGAGPAFLTNRFRALMPRVTASGIRNIHALRPLAQGAIFGGAAVAGLTTKDLLSGMNLAEQFDIRTPEGQQSAISKALAFGFTSLGRARMQKKMEDINRKLGALDMRAAKEAYQRKIMPVAELVEKSKKLPGKLPITVEEAYGRVRALDDVELETMARALKVIIPNKYYTRPELRLRHLFRGQGALDTRAPGRVVFENAGRDQLFNRVMSEYPRATEKIAGLLARNRKGGQVLYKIVQIEDAKIPKSDYPTVTNEGVVRGAKGKLSLKPVKLDPTTKDQRAAYAGLVRRYIEDLDKVPQWKEIIDTRVLLVNTQRGAIADALGAERGHHLWKYLAKNLLKPRPPRASDYMTGHETADFLKFFKARVSRAFTTLEAETFRLTGKWTDMNNVLAPYWETPISPQARADSSLWRRISSWGMTHYFRQTGARMYRLQDKHPKLRTGDLYYAISSSYSRAQTALEDVQSMLRWAWTNELGGKVLTRRWAPFRELMHYVANPKNAAAIGVQKLAVETVAKKVGWTGTPKQLEATAKQIWGRLHNIYNWGHAQTGMSADRFLEEYLPRIIKWQNSGMVKDLDQFLIESGMAKKDANSFTDLIHRLNVPPSQQLMPTEKIPFYEKKRVVDRFVKHLLYERDPIVATDKYFRMLTRRQYKEPMLPVVNHLVKEIRANLAEYPNATPVLKSIKWMMDSWWGMPSSMDRLTSGYHPIMSGLQFARERFPALRKVIPKITEKNYHGVRDFFDFVTTGAYGATLGYNPMPVLKNITQSNHNMIINGYAKSIKTIGRLVFDTKFRARVANMRGKIRREYLDMPRGEASAATQLARRWSETGMIAFRGADTFNTSGSIGNALLSMDDALALRVGGKFTPDIKIAALSKLNLRRGRWIKYIADRFRRLPGVAKEYRHTYAGTKTLGDLIWRDLMAGRIDRATLQYAKFMTYMGQYAYGGMESAPIFRGSLNRLAFMYMSWPINYTEFLSSMMSSRTGREWIRLGVSWAAFMALAKELGQNWYTWVGPGPYPTELDLQSPVVGAARAAYRIANIKARAAQGWIVGAEDDYYLLHQDTLVPHEMERFEQMVPGRRGYELMTGEEMFP